MSEPHAPNRLHLSVMAVALGLGGLCSPAAFAQVEATAPLSAEAPIPIGQVYEPSFFATFAPKTAADMIQNVPGFTLKDPDQQRGLGQSRDNVIINGRRVSGKSNSAVEALDRISADAVVRIEILEGASLSIPGMSGQVANVVTRPMGLSGSFEWNAQVRADLKPDLTRGEASLTGEAGAFSYTLGLHNFGNNDGSEGIEQVTDASGRLDDFRFEKSRVGEQRPGVNGSLTWLGQGGEVLNVNASLGYPDSSDFEQSQRSGPNQIDRLRFFHSSSQGEEGEFGADYEFPLAGGLLKLIGLQSFENSEEFSRVDESFADSRPAEGERFYTDSEASESIARAEYSFPPGFGGNWQAAVEGAYNRLESSSLYEQMAPTGAFAPETPSATMVEEKRGEASLTFLRALTPSLDLQATLGGEYSQISQEGANGLTREFVRPKGLVALAWKATDSLDLNFKLERVVGQLDFDDFASTNDLGADTRTAGNEELVPEQEWLKTIDIRQRLGVWGTLTLKVFHSSIQDVVDLIPIYRCNGARIETASACTSGTLSRTEGVGNIDSAERVGLNVVGTINFDPVGFNGAKLDFDVNSQYSRVDDPVTGETRRISRNNLSDVEVEFRQDVPSSNWAWGVGFQKHDKSPNFSLTQISKDRVIPGYTRYFVEHKNLAGLRARLTVLPRGPIENLTRDIYSNGRDQPLSYIEDRDRKYAAIFRLSVSGSF